MKLHLQANMVYAQTMKMHRCHACLCLNTMLVFTMARVSSTGPALAKDVTQKTYRIS